MDTLLNTQFFASQIFWLAVSFTVLLFVVWKYVTPALAQTLDERAYQIRADLKQAEQLRTDAEKKLADYTAKLEQAQEEATQLIATARREAEDIAAQRAATHEAELKRKADAAEEAIELAKTKAMDELTARVAELTVLATEKAIRAELDSAKAETYTSEAIRELN